MKRIYLDNAATAFPKAPGVGKIMKHYLEKIGCTVKRGKSSIAFRLEEQVYETREMLCKLFHVTTPENVIFTMNVTQSLNFILKGLLKPGQHCIISSMEHNAVMRPLVQLEKTGVEYTRITCNPLGELDPRDVSGAVRPNTRAVVLTHASNVCGTILPLQEIGVICRQKNLFFIVDSAQTAGIIDIDIPALGIDALAFTGHKGLLGPQGIGGFILTDSIAQTMECLISGGTGSLSDQEEIPAYPPDKFEAGTPNLPGILGLKAALTFLEGTGLEAIRKREKFLTATFLDNLREIKGIRTLGLPRAEGRTAVVSVDFLHLDNGEAAWKLEKYYGILTRSGLHCAPSAHKTLGTFPQGTVRFSFSHANTLKEVEYAIKTIKKITG